MAGRIRRQHVVSQFYLKGFANASNQIRRVVLPGDTNYVLATSDASVVKDFYTITLPDGTESDAFERALGEVESPASTALASIVGGTWPLEKDHRAALAAWIALQHLRSEDVRASQGTIASEMIRLLVGASGKEALRRVIEKAENRTVPNDELDWEWRDITKPGGPDMVPTAKQHVLLLLSMFKDVFEYMYQCHWNLYRFQVESIVTSDHPVSLLARPDYPSWSGVGWATADLFLVPLTRRLLLTIQPRHRLPVVPGVAPEAVPDMAHSGFDRLARASNQETASRARRYVYHHPEDSPLGGITLPEPELRGPTFSDTDGLIREEGIGAGLTGKQLRRMEAASGQDESDGMTIADLPWPIPGRRKPNRD